MVSCFKIIWKGIVCMKITKVFWFVTWLVVSIPLKNMKVSWDDEIPNTWKVIKNVPNHQPEHVFLGEWDW